MAAAEMCELELCCSLVRSQVPEMQDVAWSRVIAIGRDPNSRQLHPVGPDSEGYG